MSRPDPRAELGNVCLAIRALAPHWLRGDCDQEEEVERVCRIVCEDWCTETLVVPNPETGKFPGPAHRRSLPKSGTANGDHLLGEMDAATRESFLACFLPSATYESLPNWLLANRAKVHHMSWILPVATMLTEACDEMEMA